MTTKCKKKEFKIANSKKKQNPEIFKIGNSHNFFAKNGLVSGLVCTKYYVVSIDVKGIDVAQPIGMTIQKNSFFLKSAILKISFPRKSAKVYRSARIGQKGLFNICPRCIVNGDFLLPNKIDIFSICFIYDFVKPLKFWAHLGNIFQRKNAEKPMYSFGNLSVFFLWSQLGNYE